MTNEWMPASFEPGRVAAGSLGQRAHPDSIAHSRRLEQKLYRVGDRAWSLVGNGLSNQTFVEGPEGLIAIDTGECVEEMRAALAAVREETRTPVVACIYTHFHYVNGTRAVIDEGGALDLPIYGHADIGSNLRRFGGEAATRYTRGLIHQFGVMLPVEGEDSVENVGLGRFLRNPDHAPYTDGYVPVTDSFETELATRIAGLDVVMKRAPSDATDSITIWFPELELAVNNLLWPALFNVFAIRGEEYRDPRVVVTGLDHLKSLDVRDLAGTHGPPLSGREEIRQVVTDYRDAIQFLWDQTVRGANKGLSLDELIEFVQLPERFGRTYHTRQFYGLAEHHVRQIYTGLFGWFDENEANLFPLPTAERASRLIEGFGGRDAVRRQVLAALEASDFRWAVELGSWLVRSVVGPDGRADGGVPEDRRLLARALREIGCSTTAANVRCWCLTRALELEGTLDLSRYRVQRLRVHEVVRAGPRESVELLSVLIDPTRAGDLEDSLTLEFDDDTRVSLTVRGGVAIAGTADEVGEGLKLSLDSWAELLGGKLDLSEALRSGRIECTGDETRIRRLLSVFDVPAFA